MPEARRGRRQPQQELMCGSRITQPRPRPQRPAAPAGTPGAAGAGALQKAGAQEQLLNENTGRGARAHRTPPPFLTHRLLRALIHSFGPCLPGLPAAARPRASAEGPGEPASGALSRGAHLIPFHSFWAFSAPGRFITFAGDGWQTCAQWKRRDRAARGSGRFLPPSRTGRPSPTGAASRGPASLN